MTDDSPPAGPDADPTDPTTPPEPLVEPLDADLAAVVAAFERRGLPPWHALSVDGARSLEAELFTPDDPPPVDAVREFAIDRTARPDSTAARPDSRTARPDSTADTAAVDDDLRLRVYRDGTTAPAEPGGDGDGDGGGDTGDRPPTTLFFHGGGWTLGTLDSADDVARLLARRTGSVVVSVDYRLAPEHPFPAAVDDAFAALRWTASHAGRLGGDPDRLVVAGTSAGGGLAAATALRAAAARERGDGTLPALAGQLLLYPMLDADLDRRSYDEFADAPLLSRADVAWFWDQYCRSPVDAVNPYAAPLRAVGPDGEARGPVDPARLPPAVIATAGRDVLRDEALAYGRRLAAAGVDVARVHRPALAHGFCSVADRVPAADAAADAVAGGLRAWFD